VEVVDPLPGFATLATPAGMREHARSECRSEPCAIALTPSVDTCLRASVSALDLRRASFEDARGPRGAAATDPGLVPPHGPVCVRAGESLRLVVEARAARAIVYQTP